MRKLKLFFIISILLMVLISGCTKNEIDIASNTFTLNDNNMNATQDAVEYYIQKKIPDKYLKGDRFFSTYRILDEVSSENSIVVFIHILCEWISSTGEVVSGGATVISITFDKSDNALVYIADRIFDEQEMSISSEITQKVKDSYYSNTYFLEMQEEIEKDIAEYLK